MADLRSLQILDVPYPSVGPHIGLLELEASRSPVENLRENLAAVRLAPVCRRNRQRGNSRGRRLPSGRSDGCRPL